MYIFREDPVEVTSFAQLCEEFIVRNIFVFLIKRIQAILLLGKKTANETVS